MKKELSISDKHQLRIAKDTLKANPTMVNIMGGMTIAEAEKILAFWKEMLEIGKKY